MVEVIENSIVWDYINDGTITVSEIYLYLFCLTECDSDDNLGIKNTSIEEEFTSTEGNLMELILFLLHCICTF